MEEQRMKNEMGFSDTRTGKSTVLSLIPKKWFAIGVFALILIIALSVTLSRCGKEEKPEISTVSVESKSSLEKVLEISELSTINFTYNAIVKVPEEKDSDKMKYYIAYEGNVLAGIDFSMIEVSIDEEAKKIEIVLPEVTIQEINIDIGSLEYIFINKKAETETVLQEAYRLSLNDLEKRASKETEIKAMARTNAISAVSALVKSWAAAYGDSYKLEVR